MGWVPEIISRNKKKVISMKIQSSIKGKLGGWHSAVFYPLNNREGYTVRGKVEWLNREDADADAIARIKMAEITGQAE